VPALLTGAGKKAGGRGNLLRNEHKKAIVVFVVLSRTFSLVRWIRHSQNPH
jgi:hypothetical protein